MEVRIVGDVSSPERVEVISNSTPPSGGKLPKYGSLLGAFLPALTPEVINALNSLKVSDGCTDRGGAMPVTKQAQKPGRNDPCHCGSGKKFKKCHWRN